MNLIEHRAEIIREIASLDEKIERIQSGKVRHQSKDGIDDQWRGTTGEVLNHYQHTKKAFEILAADLAELIAKGET